MAYNGSIELISGIKAKNDGAFPLVDAKDVRVDDSTRLNEALAAIGNGRSLPEIAVLAYQLKKIVPHLAFVSDSVNGANVIRAAENAVSAMGGIGFFHVETIQTRCDITGLSGYAEGDTCICKVVPNDGYAIRNVSVAMGGADITSSAWDGETQTITIPYVTNTIRIVATAGALTTYTITKSLSHCAVSNSSVSAAEGSSYAATLTADSGYTLNTVAVTMGGTDITSTAWNSGTQGIAIASVTGNIVITATATAITLSSISASYSGSGHTVYVSDSLDSLKTYLTVTATYSDSSTETISSGNYTLSGTLAQGTSTITVSYSGKTTTFTVTVAADPASLSSISASYDGSGHTVYENDSLDSLKPYLTVTATYSDSSTATISSGDYTLSGTLSVGTSTITVTYGGKTTTFTVTVSVAPPSLSSISAVLDLNGNTINTNNSLNDLKTYLTVTGTYSDSSTATISANDYTLSGSLDHGTKTITVSSGGKTAAFTVTVYAALPSGYTELAYIATDGSQYIDPQITSGSVAHAEYEIMVTSLNNTDTALSSSDQSYTKGNHIFSGRNMYFPYIKGNSSGWQNELAGNRFGTQSPSGENESITFNWNLNQRYVLSGYANNEVKVDGVTQYHLGIGGSATGETMIFFGYGYEPNKRKYRLHGRMYYAKLYNSGGILIHDYVPCKNSSNVAGLYDLIGQTFVSSATSDALIAGEAV